MVKDQFQTLCIVCSEEKTQQPNIFWKEEAGFIKNSPTKVKPPGRRQVSSSEYDSLFYFQYPRRPSCGWGEDNDSGSELHPFLTGFSVNGSTSNSIVNESTENANAFPGCKFAAPRISSAGSEEHSNHQAKATTMLNSPSRSTPAEINLPSVFYIAKELDIALNLPKGDQTSSALKVYNLRKKGGIVKGDLSRRRGYANK